MAAPIATKALDASKCGGAGAAEGLRQAYKPFSGRLALDALVLFGEETDLIAFHDDLLEDTSDEPNSTNTEQSHDDASGNMSRDCRNSPEAAPLKQCSNYLC